MLKSKKGIIKPKLESGNLGLEISRIDTIFTKAGLKEISVPSLLNSSDLVDLYGEDLKLRAYTTSDPVRGEQILRPDFTVPILLKHLRGSSLNPEIPKERRKLTKGCWREDQALPKGPTKRKAK